MKIATVCSDNYVHYLEKLIRSILKHNEWFDLEFVVIHDQRLSEESKKRLLASYPFKFHEFNFGEYEKNYKASIKFASMEAFKLEGNVIFLDADLICLGDIEPILIYADMSVSLSMSKEKRRVSERYNSGLVIIPSNMTGGVLFDRLMGYDISNINCQLNDQKLYNHYFTDICEIPGEWNCMVSEVDFFERKDIIFLHYIYKPDTNHDARSRLEEWQIKEWELY